MTEVVARKISEHLGFPVVCTSTEGYKIMIKTDGSPRELTNLVLMPGPQMS